MVMLPDCPGFVVDARPKPKLAELGLDLLRLSRWQLLRAIGLPLVAFVSYWFLAAWGAWVAAVLCLMALSFFTYGSTSHDLVHGSLRLNRRTNDVLLAVLEGLALRSGHAYQVAHLHHHARFPHDDDIEAEAARMSFGRALLEGVVFPVRIYVWALRNPRGRKAWIVGEGIGVTAALMAALAALPWTPIAAVYVGLMIAGSWTIPLITSYLPHRADGRDAVEQTRRFRGWVLRIIALDHLYHLEHHLYPAVPHQNWPALAQRLDPWLDAVGVEPVRIGFLVGAEEKR